MPWPKFTRRTRFTGSIIILIALLYIIKVEILKICRAYFVYSLYIPEAHPKNNLKSSAEPTALRTHYNITVEFVSTPVI